MGEHDAIRSTAERVLCRCGEWFDDREAHRHHFDGATARAVAEGGLAAARAALRGDRGAVEWGSPDADRLVMRLLVGAVLSLLVLLVLTGPEPDTSGSTSPDPMTYEDGQP